VYVRGLKSRTEGGRLDKHADLERGFRGGAVKGGVHEAFGEKGFGDREMREG